MDRRPLGQTGLHLSAVGLGASELAHRDLAPDDAARLVRHALDLGINVIDTAECYPHGEEKVGHAVGFRRDQVVLCTKVGHAKGFRLAADWDPRLVRASVDRSLARLGTDHLDILFLHSCDLETLKNAALVDQVIQMRALGKTRAIGYAGDHDAALFAVRSGIFDCVQVSLSLADQHALEAIIPAARERHVGVLAKRSLANAAWLPPTPNPGDYRHEYAERLEALDYDALRRAPDQAARFALRFVIHQPGVHCALLGTTSPAHLNAAADAWSAGPLSQADEAAVRARWRQVARPDWVGLT